MDAFTYSTKRGVRGRLAAAILAAALLIPAAAADAATVTTTEDGGPGSLRQAIADAQPGETIALPAGTYTLTKGQLNVTKTVTIAGAGASTTAISGNKASRIFEVLTDGVSLTISGVTLSEGVAHNVPFAEGAAIRQLNDGDLTLRDDVITGNSAGLPGSLVAGGTVAYEGRRLTIVDTHIVGNSGTTDATSEQPNPNGVIGGAVFATGATVVVERSSIADNHFSSRGLEGASSIEEEGASLGGGALLEGTNVLRIRHSTISGNVLDTSNQGGGGLGRGKAGGLAIFAEKQGKVRLEGVTIADNEVRTGTEGAAEGGGLEVFNFAGVPVEVTGSTIASNSIEGIPGGELAEEGFLSQGGNVTARGEEAIVFADTIIADGIGPEGSENCGGTEAESSVAGIISRGFNLDTADDCGLKFDGDINGRAAPLGPLQDNGGPTATMLPGAGSAAIDQGSAFGQATDQRGLGRPVDLAGVPNSTAEGADGSDIGAVEVQGTTRRAQYPRPLGFSSAPLACDAGGAERCPKNWVARGGPASFSTQGLNLQVKIFVFPTDFQQGCGASGGEDDVAKRIGGGRAMTAEQAEAFARDWIAAWNAHDLDRILSYYSDDVVFSSPFVIRLVGAPSGEASGLEALRVYVTRGLEAYPDMHLEPIEVLPGAGSIALRYRSVDGREAIETLELDRAGKIRRCTAHYSAPAAVLA